MLRWRLMGAAAIITPLVLMLWLDASHNAGYPGIWLVPLGILFAVAASCEIVMLRTDQSWTDDVTDAAIGAFAAASLMLVPVFYHPVDCPLGRWGWTALGLFAGLAVISLLQMRKLTANSERALLPYLVFSVFYVVLPLAFLLQTRLLYPDKWGVIAILSIAAVVKFNDTGAFFVGRSLGRHKMAPVLSPKKTIEGAVGGIVTAVLAAMWLHLHVFPYAFGVHHADTSPAGLLLIAIYGLTLAGAGIFGDLAESYLKRVCGQKDSAKWLPGLGGCLDVLDSALWAAPVGYLWWAAGLFEPLH